MALLYVPILPVISRPGPVSFWVSVDEVDLCMIGEVEGHGHSDNLITARDVEAEAPSVHLFERDERPHVALYDVADFLDVQERLVLGLVVGLSEHGVFIGELVDFNFEGVGLAVLNGHHFRFLLLSGSCSFSMALL